MAGVEGARLWGASVRRWWVLVVCLRESMGQKIKKNRKLREETNAVRDGRTIGPEAQAQITRRVAALPASAVLAAFKIS